jgi:hypothetical protein
MYPIMSMKLQGLVEKRRIEAKRYVIGHKWFIAQRRIRARGKGELKMKASPIMLLKTKGENFGAGLIPSYL